MYQRLYLYGGGLMKVRLSLLFVIALAGGLSVTASTANVQKHPAPPAVGALPYDEVEACPLPNGDAYPVEITPAGTGPLLSLPILVLLDGIPVPEAKRIVRDVNAMYGKMNIALTATYAPFPLKADGAAVDRQPTYGTLAALKAVQKRYPRPPGDAALVHLLSAKDLLDDNNPQRDGTDRVAGIADCIGGVRLVGLPVVHCGFVTRRSRVVLLDQQARVNTPKVATGTPRREQPRNDDALLNTAP